MQTTVQFLDAVKAARGVSDYALAPLLGVSKAQISRYRRRHEVLSANVGRRIAELLNLDPAYVRACAEAERAERAHDGQELAMWQRVAARFSAIVVAFAALAMLEPAPAWAGFDKTFFARSTGPNYTLARIRRWLARLLGGAS